MLNLLRYFVFLCGYLRRVEKTHLSVISPRKLRFCISKILMKKNNHRWYLAEEGVSLAMFTEYSSTNNSLHEAKRCSENCGREIPMQFSTG